MQAEKICTQRNMYLAPQRLEVLRSMSLQDGATNAYDLPDLLHEAKPQAKPPAVYHALEFLPEQGFVRKVESTNSYVLCYLFDQSTHISAIFICDCCGAVEEECVEGVEDIVCVLVAKMGFVLRYNVTEAHGSCPAYAEVEACRHPERCHRDYFIQVKKKPC